MHISLERSRLLRHSILSLHNRKISILHSQHSPYMFHLQLKLPTSLLIKLTPREHLRRLNDVLDLTAINIDRSKPFQLLWLDVGFRS